jgi:hypothetical protein
MIMGKDGNLIPDVNTRTQVGRIEFAFPNTLSVRKGASADEHVGTNGITVRDYFAGKALVGLLAGRANGAIVDVFAAAEIAGQIADAMLAERAK